MFRVRFILIVLMLLVGQALADGLKFVEIRDGDKWIRVLVVDKQGDRYQVQLADGSKKWVGSEDYRLAGANSQTPAAPGQPDAPGTVTPPAEPATTKPVTLDSPKYPVNLDVVQLYKKPTGGSVPIAPTTKPSGAFTAFKPKDGADGIGRVVKLFPVGGTPTMVAGIGESDGEASQLALIETNAPAPFEVRPLPIAARSVLGVADGGRFVYSKPTDNDDAIIHVWEFVDQHYTLKTNLELVAKGGKVRIEYALVVGAGRVVVGVNNEMMFLIDVPSRHAIGQVKVQGSRAHLHASGKLIETEKEIIRVSDLQIMTEFKNANWNIASVDPTGTVAAFGTGETLNVVKLPAATEIAVVPGVLKFNGGICLLNANTAMVGPKRGVIDIKTAVPIWQYSTPNETQSLTLSNGETFLAFVNGNMTNFAMADLPDPAASAALKSAKDESYDLLPGVAISITGDLAGIYGADAPTVKKSLEKAITNAGDKVVDTTTRYQLAVTSAPGKSIPQSYEIHTGPMGLNGTFKVDAPSTVVTIALNFDNKPIWTKVLNHQAQVLLSLHKGQSVQDAVNAAAKPNPSFLNNLAIPKYIVRGGSNTEGELTTLGRSTISPDGISKD